MFFPVLLIAGVASAFPQHGGFPGGPPGGFHGGPGDSNFPAWVAPGPGDGSYSHNAPAHSDWWRSANDTTSTVRSPCPALNTLANHGYIPHSGKGLTTEIIIAGFKAGQNYAADTVTGAAAGALALCAEETGAKCTSWDLDMLDHPHAIEHDNSLSREDYNFGADNNTVFSQRVWGQVLGVWHGSPIIDFKLANAARMERVGVASATDVPGWYVNASAQTLGETAFYISLFGDPVEGNARQDWIDVWFQQERMPFELGWTPGQRQTITEALLTAMQAKIAAA